MYVDHSPDGPFASRVDRCLSPPPPNTTQVLVFRGQEKLSPERHVEFSRCFGDLYCHVIGASHDAVRAGLR